MKIKHLFLLAILCVGLTGTAFAQFSIRPSARLLWATRGGFFVGANHSFHKGHIPTNPSTTPTLFGTQQYLLSEGFTSDEQSTNFIFGAHIDKAVSSNVTLGLRVIFDQMNINVGEYEPQPFRVSDELGNLYEVAIDNNTDYTLQYLTFAGVIKIYFYRTYGFYILGGASVGTLLTGEFNYNPVVVLPDWARGSEGPGVTREIPEVNSFRFSLIPGIGYDFYYRGMFISPELTGDIALTDVLDDTYSSSEPWKVWNLQGTIRISFIIL